MLPSNCASGVITSKKSVGLCLVSLVIISVPKIMRNNKYWFWMVLGFLTLLAATGVNASEADIHIPRLDTVKFNGLGGMAGATLMYWGIVICFIGAAFGLVQYKQTKALPVHKSMAD